MEGRGRWGCGGVRVEVAEPGGAGGGREGGSEGGRKEAGERKWQEGEVRQ